MSKAVSNITEIILSDRYEINRTAE